MVNGFIKVLLTYLSSIVMLIQSTHNILMPYRVYGVMVSTAIVAPNLNKSALLTAAVLGFAPKKANAAKLEAPVFNCPNGFDKIGGDCKKQEVADILRNCSTNGYTPQTVNELNLGIPINTCLATYSKFAAPICNANEVRGGANDQQCRQETSLPSHGVCPDNYKKEGNICVTDWRFLNPNQYICEDLCNIPLSNPTDKCPASQDPLLIAEKNYAECTSNGASEGLCTEGERVELVLPNQEWAIESPLQAPNINPVMCYRSLYEKEIRECPTPNRNNTFGQSAGEPLWGTPDGNNGDNPMYFDEETGAPTHCLRVWSQDVVIECPAGTTFSDILGACQNTASVQCPEGTTYENGQCVGGDKIECPSTHEFDDASQLCVRILTDPKSFDQQFSSGADLGWAIGGLQASKKQSANQQGDLVLDMGLLNKEANDQLQANKDRYKDVVAIGENDRTHNQYADIDQTYFNEKEQTKVIVSNHQSYTEYLNNPNPEHLNLAAEAYGFLDDNIKLNRPPPINPDSDIIGNSQDIIQGLGDGTDPFFGDCEEGGTKKVLNPDKQIITEESCTKPVVMNFDSCQVKRYVEDPSLKILEGAEKSEVTILSDDTIRLTIGEMCDDCLSQRPGENCSLFTAEVRVQIAMDVKVEKATFTSAIYDDLIVVEADGSEIFRKAPAPWTNSGWPSPSDSCEQNTSFSWSGSEDVTEQFYNALDDDGILTFRYKVGVGGDGEGRASVDIKFDQSIRTEWFDEPRYHPEGCNEKIESGQCTTSGWVCDLQIAPDTLGMENWFEWDAVRNWHVYDQGYAARSTLNGAFSVYGSKADVGHLWFKGNTTVKDGSDDDSFGFVFGYPTEPVYSQDPRSASYVANTGDRENNFYYVMLWTNNHGNNGTNAGLSLYKSYVPYSDLERLFSGHWGINFHQDMYLTDNTGQQVKVVDNIFSDRSFKWQNHRSYELEFKQDEQGNVSFYVDKIKKIDIKKEQENFKTGRFGFATVSLNNVHFENMRKVMPQNFLPLFPGDDNPSRCMAGHAENIICDSLSPGKGILDPNGKVWSNSNIRDIENTCKPLQNNPECTWVKRECVDAFKQSDGSCLVEKEIYQCIDNSNAWEEVPVNTTCDVLPCIDGDEDCELRGDETNPDFADVVGQLGVVNEMRNYMECSDPEDVNSCEVFKGEQRTCSYDQFGLIDCCEEFKGKTIDLFSLALNTMKVASFADEQLGISESVSNQMFGTDGLDDGWIPDDLWGAEGFVDGAHTAITDVGQDIKDGVTSAWEGVSTSVNEAFAKPSEAAAGEASMEAGVKDAEGIDTGKMFTDYFKDMVIDELIDEMVAQAMDKILSMLSKEMVEAIVKAGVELGLATAADQIGVETAKKVLSQGMAQIGAVLGAIGAAYAAVQIALALYQLLNGCDEEESDMSQTLKEKKCFYSHTTDCDKLLGICQRKYRKRHCCFSSLMSRLIMEQAITQPEPFGGSSYDRKRWYELENCRGLTLYEVPLVDFSKIDLDEWYDLMVQSGTLPDGDDSLEEFTKERHYANPYGRSDSRQLQFDRGVSDYNKEYREVMDNSDVLGEVDCSSSPNIQGCQTGIFGTK